MLSDVAEAYIGWKYPLPRDVNSASGDQARNTPAAEPSGSRPSASDAAGSNPRPGDQGTSQCPGDQSTSRHTASSLGVQDSTQAPEASRDTTHDFPIDIISLERKALFRRDAHQITVVALAEGGYLAASPVSPTLAISFRTLEYFRQLRLRKASYSVEAFAKVLSDLYGVSALLAIRHGKVMLILRSTHIVDAGAPR